MRALAAHPSHHLYSRDGNKNMLQVTLRQLLIAAKHAGKFVAVIRDPETNAVLARIDIWRPSEYGESVDLTVDFDRDDPLTELPRPKEEV